MTHGPRAASGPKGAQLPFLTSYWGTREWFVIHHSNCGMDLFSNEVMRGLLTSSSLTTARHSGRLVEVARATE